MWLFTSCRPLTLLAAIIAAGKIRALNLDTMAEGSLVLPPAQPSHTNKSAKPGRADEIEYSIDLRASQLEEYSKQYIFLFKNKNQPIVVMGDSLGS